MIYFQSVIAWFGNMQFVAVLAMLRCAFERKVSRKKSLALLAGSIIGFALSNVFFNMRAQLDPSFGQYAFIAFIILLFFFNWLYGFFALCVDWRQLTESLLFFVTFLEFSLLISITLADSFEWFDDMGRLLVIPLIVLLCVWVKRVTCLIKVPFSPLQWVLVNMIPILMNLLITFWQGQRQGNYFLLTGLVLFAMDLTIYYLFCRLAKKTTEQAELMLDNKMLNFHLQQMEEVHVMLENTRSLRHEIRTHFFLIESLIREKKDDEAIAYIHQTIEPALAKEEKVSTGNSFVDMVLSRKTAEARENGIPVTLNVLLPANLNINQEMLCSLLLNLWDNAIEASSKASAPDIRFSMNLYKSYLNIMISNSIDASVLASNPQLNTSKADPVRHGMGIRLVRKAVESNHGDMRIYEEDGYFVISIFLELNDRIE